ncbi:MAG: type II toxin-antitoxin system RelE/ParE family toxin [Nanoarchaeota archaeon]|nr:type II toxin-antitoxin system RelE/ParE family toxin [Nanoarchaeota archaeon]
MTYSIQIKPLCKDSIAKLCKKNGVLEKALRNKIEQVIENPNHFKPLRCGLSGERRVHILKSFVLKYEIDEQTKTVTFLAFSHHDDAYLR